MADCFPLAGWIRITDDRGHGLRHTRDWKGEKSISCYIPWVTKTICCEKNWLNGLNGFQFMEEKKGNRGKQKEREGAGDGEGERRGGEKKGLMVL